MSRAELMGLLLAFIARLVTGAQGHWKGCPPEATQRIYFANHQSHLDWVLIWAALPHELRAARGRSRPRTTGPRAASSTGSRARSSTPST
jgi:1-acyl-sn-glycerol-3-phosphate acyltransferase